jgi:predicted PurR-regulated permease PerM
MARDRQIRAMLAICTAILATTALYFAGSIFAPITFAIFILAIVWPLQKSLQRWMPKGVALFLTLALTALVVLVFASIVVWALSSIAVWMQSNLQKFQTLYAQVTDWFEGHGIFVAGVLAERFNAVWLLRMFQQVAIRLNQLAGFGVVVFIFLMLELMEMDQIRRRIASLDRANGAAFIEAAAEIGAKFRRYMLVRTQLSVLTGVLVWAFALITGIEPAAGWGMLAFTLNYIPFIGPLVATVLPALFAMAQLDTWHAVVLVLVGLTLIQFLIGNYLEPLVAGAALAISPLVVVFAVFFWGFLWGITGAFIGVPIMISVISLCARYPSTQWVATLLSGTGSEAVSGR